MSFSRHKEIYRSDVLGKAGSDSCSSSPPSLIGCDEFPVGYSLAGCSPAEPSLRFADCKRFSTTPRCGTIIFQRTASVSFRNCLTLGVHPNTLYVFGFSRGAYTARALCGMLHIIGLLREDNEGLIPYSIRMLKEKKIEKQWRRGRDSSPRYRC